MQKVCIVLRVNTAVRGHGSGTPNSYVSIVIIIYVKLYAKSKYIIRESVYYYSVSRLSFSFPCSGMVRGTPRKVLTLSTAPYSN